VQPGGGGWLASRLLTRTVAARLAIFLARRTAYVIWPANTNVGVYLVNNDIENVCWRIGCLGVTWLVAWRRRINGSAWPFGVAGSSASCNVISAIRLANRRNAGYTGVSLCLGVTIFLAYSRLRLLSVVGIEMF
jgi:hypothetical protein